MRDLYVHTPFGETVADGDYPTDETTGVVKKKYEHLQYDPFGARANYAGDPAERYLHDIVSFGYEGNNYDKSAGGYLAGGNLHEPQSGRLMSPAGGGENPYVYGGNSPVDRSLGVSRQQMADDFTSSRFDAGYSHYLDPREGWNGNAEDRLFAIGKFAAWGVAIVAGSAASMMAAGVGTIYAGATYLATQAGWAAGETALEGAIAYGTGTKFDAASSFGKNFAVNSATAGLSSAAKWGSKAARYAVRMGAEVAAETTYDVAVNDADFGTSLAINTGASLGFDALGAGIGYGARKFTNSRAGRASVAYATGFIQSPGSGRALVGLPMDVGGSISLALLADLRARHIAGMSAVRTTRSALQTPVRPGLRNRPDPARSIDTRIINNPADTTAEGYPRDNIAFWLEWARRHPETMSDVNIKLINGINPKTGRSQLPTSPKIDPQWILHNPHHADYMHKKLIHHHAMWVNPETKVFEPGPYAFPVPQPTHKGQEGVWHHRT